MIYREFLARHFGKTDLGEIESCFIKEMVSFLENMDSADLEADEAMMQQLIKEGLEDGFIMAATTVALRKTPYVISAELCRELNRVDFKPDLKEGDYVLHLPQETLPTPKEITDSVFSNKDYYVSIRGGEIMVITYAYILVSDGKVLLSPPMSYYAPDLEGIGSAELLLKAVHYIQHLGNPDLRKAIPFTSKKPKKTRQRLRSEENLYDMHAVTLGYKKERRFSKEFWAQRSHLRLQPVGPRDSPSYKLIEIAEQLKTRRS